MKTDADPRPTGDADSTRPRVGRRAMLGVGALAAGASLVGATATRFAAPDGAAGGGPDAGADTQGGFGTATAVAAAGPLAGLQPGIVTPQQAHCVFLGLDLARGTGRARIVTLLRLVGDDASALMRGATPLGVLEPHPAAGPSRLTVTFGFGPGLFTAAGLESACPAGIATFPRFATDRLEPRWGQTDLVVQVCADDEVAVSYARRRLLRDAAPFTTLRWVQRGFVTAHGAEPTGTTPRNLMGMRDGSANERDPAQVADVVRCTDRRQPWLVGGSQLVLRRIRIDLDTWDDVDPRTKEATFGRRLADGAPLTGHAETDVVDRTARDAAGFLIVEPAAHAARAQARSGSERMLRRGYNYDDGPDEKGRPDAGLLFAAYQADIASAFVPVQRRLAELDAINVWTTHVGSAVYAVPPAAPEGSVVGGALLGA